MKRCPKCNCGAEFTNKLAYYAANAGSGALALGAGLAAAAVHPSSGGHVSKEVFENVTKNVKKHYKCTNCNCEYEWEWEE